MSLIDLYVSEVGKRLPLRSRKDIESELRSTLEDMLEDRSRKAGRPADDGMVKDLLKEYGPPDKVAATYQPTQYLIGPRLFPFFSMVLKIVLTVLIVVQLIGLGVEVSSQMLQGMELARAIGSGLLNLVGSLLQAFGNIVLVFAIMERVMPASEFKFDEEKKQWDPSSLMKEERKAEVKLWDPILSILFTVLVMVVFNFYPQWIGIWFLKDGVWTSVPALTDSFFRWLPALNGLWLLEIGLNLVLLRQGRWQTATRWASVGLRVLSIGILLMLIAASPIVSLAPAALQATGMFDAVSAAKLNQGAQQGARGIIILIAFLRGSDVIREGIRLIRERS